MLPPPLLPLLLPEYRDDLPTQMCLLSKDIGGHWSREIGVCG